MTSAWNRFWFAPRDPRDLGIARALYIALTVFVCFPPSAPKWPVTPWSAMRWTEVSDAYWVPVGVFDWLGIGVAPAQVMFALWAFFYVALLLAGVGLFTRPSLVLVFVLDLYLTNIRNNFGKVDWNWLLPPIIFLFLACSRAGDGFSVDAWLRRRRGQAPPTPSGEHRWPLQAIRMWLALAYFASGVSKLRNGGVEWITSDTLGIYILRSNYERVFAGNHPIVDWGLWFAQQHALLVALALFTVVVELLYPLALFSRRAAWVLVPSAALLHVGIAFLIGAFFLPWICAVVFWIPWGAVVDRLRRGRARPSASPSPAPS